MIVSSLNNQVLSAEDPIDSITSPSSETNVSSYAACLLVKRGIKSAYIESEDNLKYFKGKLDINKQIKHNTVHHERFYVHYDEYRVNRPENKLIKSTLLKLLRITANSENSKEIRKLLYAFELVEPSKNYEKDFSRVTLTRDMQDYRLLISWARIFLLNKSFTTFSGKDSGKALLFPMEQVFEAFVAKQLRSVFEKTGNGTIRVSAQDVGYYLFDSPKKFRLRPDIVVRHSSDSDHSIVIMDTKWKRLTNNPSTNYGISQVDMYQMYAYAKKYNTSNIWLIYPTNEEVKNLDTVSFSATEENEKAVNVSVFFVDLEYYKESIQGLYGKVYKQHE